MEDTIITFHSRTRLLASDPVSDLGVQKSPETVKTGRVRKVFFFQIPPEHNMN